MTNPQSSDPRPPRDERNDELIASVIAFSVIGCILYWGIGRGDRPTALANRNTQQDREVAVDELAPSDELVLAPDGADPLERTARLPFGGTPATELDASASALTDDREGSDSLRVIQSLPSNPSSRAAEATLGAAVIAPPLLAEEEEEVAASPEESRAEETPPGDAGVTDDGSPANFTDVAPDYWATPFIAGLSQAEIISGFGDGNFQPDQPITRAEFASLLSQSFEPGADPETVPYTDVTPDYWASGAIAQVTAAGFMSGYPGNEFRPNQPVSRLEVLVSLVSGLDLLPPTETASLLEAYGDRDQIAAWAAPRIAAATDAGLVVNHPDANLLKPNQPATRAESAAMIYQALAEQNQVEPVTSPFIVER
ncbi:MAG: S-layer homology domain-containing protein [Synechococcales bacterium]|nr:S-layer homology domain-containing protein [Synechococcales bacterium]